MDMEHEVPTHGRADEPGFRSQHSSKPRQFVLRHWRGRGQIIPDVKRKRYYDYPKHRNKPPYYLNDCLVKEITEEEFKKEVLTLWGKDALNRLIKKHKLKRNDKH